MSLTGYEPQLAKSLALSVDDQRLGVLSTTARNNGLFVVAGAPLKLESQVEVGAVVISPSGAIATYSKMHLHPGEEDYFSAGKQLKMLEVENQKVALAICADMNSAVHIDAYVEQGATVYAGGVLITESGYVEDTREMASDAQKHNMLVAMANHNQPTGGWSPIGRSAIWDGNGLLSAAGKTEDVLLMAQQINGAWTSEIIKIE